jgi:hypothetical protein
MAGVIDYGPSTFNLLDALGMGSPAQQIPVQANDPVPVQPPQPAIAPAPNSPNDIIIQGDDWQPTHRNLFGRIADALAGHPIYENRMRERDMVSAMQGFANDPLTSIRRIARIPGMADDAYRMYQKYQADQDTAEYKRVQTADKQAKAHMIIGAMLGAPGVNADNYAEVLDRAKEYARSYEIDPETLRLPETYDQNKIAAFAYGTVPFAQQKALEIRQGNAKSADEYRKERIQLGKTGQAATESRFERSQSAIQGRFNTNQQRLTQNHQDAQKAKAEVKPRAVNTKYGPGEVVGNRMKVKLPNGQVVKYITNDGKNWKLIK